MFDLAQKLEASAAALITNLGLSVSVTRNNSTADVDLNVQTGLTQQDKALPSVTVAAITGNEYPQGSGNFTLSFSAELRSNADETTLEAHRAFCEAAIAPLMSDDTETQLTAAETDFGVLGISNRQCSERIEDRSWITALTFDAYCCGLALA